ncbi:MAG: TSUP family transporter [Chloroflexales bacterium]|nr:TSUP family transporter [Chloroflexales bacterium]
MLYVILTALLFGLSFLAGMMGLGVAFIATPVLGLFGFELKHEIMPLALWLNGVTAIAGAVTFARKGMVDWRTAVPLLILTSLAAVLGAQTGAAFMARRVKSLTLTRVFATALVLIAAQRVWLLAAA